MDGVLIPTLETNRLHLVPLTENHWEGMFELWSSKDVCKYCLHADDKYGKPIELPVSSRDGSDKIIEFFLDYSAQGKGFRWAMEAKEDGAFVGALGYNSLGKVSELAYHLIPRYWNRGLMTEACLSAVKWNRDTFAPDEIVAFIEKENRPSAKLAERLGFRQTTEEREGAFRYVLASG